MRAITGTLTVDAATFQAGAKDDGVYWSVAAHGAEGAVTLGFEPYAGRLVRVARAGGAQ